MLPQIIIFFWGVLLVDGQNCNDTSVCYERAGECYNNCPPFNEFPLPRAPETMTITFEMFTQRFSSIPEVIDENNLGIRFERERPTVVIVHGEDGPGSLWVRALKGRFLEKADYNLIVAGWPDGAAADETGPYPQANARVMGTITGNLLFNYWLQKNMDIKSVHCVGLGIGAHLCGYAAAELASRIGRITGLDPAGDYYDAMTDLTGRIDPDDADFVDIIHTNARGYVTRYGSEIELGHVDFWVNGAGVQGECQVYNCAHRIATDYFEESLVSSCPFTSNPCDSVRDALRDACHDNCTALNDCQHMGFNSILHPGRGNYWLATNAQPPYCIN